MDDLVESILDYIRADYTDYAIMINGEWGSGKTYFWNHKIRNKIEAMQINGKKYTTIYMSLYGISNLEEISKKIKNRVGVTTQVGDLPVCHQSVTVWSPIAKHHDLARI